MSGWSLVAAEYRFPMKFPLAAHRMIVVIDPMGKVTRQLHGYASWFDWSARCWRHKPIGYLPSDRLRAYDTGAHPNTWLPMYGVGYRQGDVDGAIERGDVVTLKSGMDSDACAGLVAVLGGAIRRINALNPGPSGGSGLPYPFLGLGRNSNSVFSTLVSVIGVGEPEFAAPASFTPGVGRILLPQTVIETLSAGIFSSLPEDA